jgi:hypothetical protein
MIHSRLRVPRPLLLATALAACSRGGDGGPGTLGSIAIEPLSAALCIGDSISFTAQVLDARGQPVAGTPVRWSSSAPEAVSIDTASGVAHALALGATVITAHARGITSDSGALDVPLDLLPEFVPDTVVLAPGDTMTLGVRLRRQSAGPVPNHIPTFVPFDSAVAGLDSNGFVHAKAAGTVGLSVSACNFQNTGGVKVFTAPDSATGQAYLWLSGRAELRASVPARAFNFTHGGGKPAFQIISRVGGNAKFFIYEDTVRLAGTGLFSLDSLTRDEGMNSGLLCNLPRPFAMYLDASLSFLTTMHGGATAVTSYASKGSWATVSGRTVVRMRGIVSGGTTVDTLRAIYTFSAPLKDTTGVCP